MHFFIDKIVHLYYHIVGDNMKVKIFDEENENDLEEDINDFIEEEHQIIDIKYQVATSIYNEEQIYCFSALILYKWYKK